ncbi:MAG: ABC transporter substrate-binding protein [Bacteroidetes bacterium]|nr:ABC transporter substrate-binding protein [Bacteroidota bacterium]
MNKLFLLAVTACLLSSCGDGGKDNDKNRVAKGERVYGGTFRYNENTEWQTLLPFAIIDAASAHIATQVYEGLVKFNPRTLKIMPCLAESWELDESKTTYTFHLKKGVYFHDYACFPDGKGREVKASDFKFSFELLCTQHKDNFSFSTSFKDRVAGVNKYYEASGTGTPGFPLEGVKVIDDYTLQLTLIKPEPNFLYILAQPPASVVPKECFEKDGDMLSTGTGPFIFADIIEEYDEATGKPMEKVILVRNANYHRTDSFDNRLPFLDSIVVSFTIPKKEELDMFFNRKLDLVLSIPAQSVREMIEQHIASFEKKPPLYVLERSTDMASHFIEFNLNSIFKDIRIRKAFSLAVDRKKIVEEILDNEGSGGFNGIVPPAFMSYGYDVTKIKGFSYDMEQAKKLLAEAGYKNGEGFPPVKMEVNVGGYNTQVAFEVQKQILNNLNVNVDIEIVPMSVKLEDAAYSRADLFMSAWIADYPAPDNFLMLLYGKTVPDSLSQPSFYNTSRYVNADFDKLFEEAAVTDSVSHKFDLYIQAEQKAIEDAPILVLWYEENYRLSQSFVNRLFLNSMHYRDFSEVFFRAPKPQPGAQEKDTTAAAQ